jgi:hypothetical protein
MSLTAVSTSFHGLLSTFDQLIFASACVLSYATAAAAPTAIDSNGFRESVVNTESLQSSAARAPAVRDPALPKAAVSQAMGPVKVTTVKKRSTREKIVAPIMQGFAELRDPVALLIAAKNHLWSAAHFGQSDSAADTVSLSAADRAPINVVFGTGQPYQVTTPTNTAMARLANAIEEELHPGIAPKRPSPLVRNSATQLNMRVNDAVSFMWDVERNESPVAGSDMGMGIGFKVAF